MITLFFISSSYSNPISKEQALKVAESFFMNKTNGKKSTSVNSINTKLYNELKTLYIINYEDGGFVIISADDRVQPILAYSETNIVSEKNPSPEFEWWIEAYSKQIEFAVKNDLVNKNAEKIP